MLAACILAITAPAMVDVSRRTALQSGAIGAAGLGASGLVSTSPAPVQAVSAAAPAQAPALVLPPIGIGAWAWGDSLFWGYDKKNDDQLQELFDYYAATPNALFDTAELYGLGRSETLLGEFERASGNHVSIASKFAALPWKTKREDVVKACKASLKRMGRDSMELYQIHFPNAWANEAYWDGLGDCYELGLVKAVGVSNYGADAVSAVSARLGARGVPLLSNQIQYSLLCAHAHTRAHTPEDLATPAEHAGASHASASRAHRGSRPLSRFACTRLEYASPRQIPSPMRTGSSRSATSSA